MVQQKHYRAFVRLALAQVPADRQEMAPKTIQGMLFSFIFLRLLTLFPSVIRGQHSNWRIHARLQHHHRFEGNTACLPIVHSFRGYGYAPEPGHGVLLE